MNAVYVIVYCTHCHTTIECYIEGLKEIGRSCDRCNNEFCQAMSPDKAVGALCDKCNWCAEDWYGHA